MVRTRTRIINFEELKAALFLKGRVVGVQSLGNEEIEITTAYDDNDKVSFDQDFQEQIEEVELLFTNIDLMLDDK